MRFTKLQLLFALTYVLAMSSFRLHAWQADNGNGTFTNPLFYDEFSDPDLIRVGDDFYLTGTTMHTMPGLPVLHSKDLVNWKFLGCALDKLDATAGLQPARWDKNRIAWTVHALSGSPMI